MPIAGARFGFAASTAPFRRLGRRRNELNRESVARIVWFFAAIGLVCCEVLFRRRVHLRIATLPELVHQGLHSFHACRSPMVALEHLLSSLALGLRPALEGLSVITVALGVLGSLRLVGRRRSLETIRLHLGRWLSMALEFQLAADIVATTVNPNGEKLIQLAAVALIRTFLNVFLAREIAQERAEEARAAGGDSAAQLAMPRL